MRPCGSYGGEGQGAAVEPDDFFEVGGYSLLAVQIIARIEKRFGVSLTVRQFFEHPSVAELSRLLL